jgi:hypothetical protein
VQRSANRIKQTQNKQTISLGAVVNSPLTSLTLFGIVTNLICL